MTDCPDRPPGSKQPQTTRRLRQTHVAGPPPPRSELEFHPLVGGHEAEPLIKAQGIRPRLVRGQLDQDASTLSCARYSVLEHCMADPGRAGLACDSNPLYQGAPSSLVGQLRNESDLQHADKRPFHGRNHQLIVRIALDGIEGQLVGSA